MQTQLLETGLAVQARARETAIETIAKLRKEAAAEITRLIAFLDASDPYVMTEREEQVDDGPVDDNELDRDDSDDEDSGDNEPSLGSVGLNEWSDQNRWAAGQGKDLEDEHDGVEPDEADYEPSIGFDACTIIAEEDTGDLEPSLGWTVDGSTGDTIKPDLEEGAPARAPQNRTMLAAIGLKETLFRGSGLAPLTGLTQHQRTLLDQKRSWTGLCV